MCTPLAVEHAVERASFEDRLGTLPVEVRLAHNAHTTLDTGLLGKVYWRRTATAGFGAELRSTGPPIAGGTLASYVSPAFVRANTRFLDDPDGVAIAYGAELRHQVVGRAVRLALVAGALGGVVLTGIWHLSSRRSRRTGLVIAGVVLVVGAATSVTLAISEFHSWAGNQAIGESFALPGHDDIAFSSPQTREVAEQIQPFIEKNTARIRDRTDRYEATAATSLDEALGVSAGQITPRDGEVVVLAEADPQGSLVGTAVRRDLYDALQERLPEGAIVLRTIAGDISSNGTVAEAGFVSSEAAASPGIPVAAAKGDHDTDVTVDQLIEGDVSVPDTEIVEAGGLRVASARDPAFKALFGGLVINDSGRTEADIGAALRSVVDDEDPVAPYDVLLHQPRAVAGYLGVDLDEVKATGTSLTTPVDDGIPDLPPGIVTYGHLHDAAGPWVVWNTDTDDVTWTVITQLGTAGGVEENPTFNRFSTPFSTPLKALSIQLQYVDIATGMQTGLVPITIATDGTATVGERVDVGLRR
ncbi:MULTISPECIES: hypothetical protein [unclassified Nocardioides]|uniref:hypothetical protein n=1 Tax=unclassified Nocardioides TaxID=2615069 RepID=UPI0012E3A27B|nr:MULTISPECIES: hypothetical protein [unclassified Nocardioides]